jgi:ABC-type Fe3+-hydroxamate transport system substrate-binding protein
MDDMNINFVKLFFIFAFCFAFSSNAENNYKYKRIISLGPAITESIYLLKSEKRLVGCTTYCIRPESAQQKERVGSTIEINLETIVSLKPDLVIGSPLTDSRTFEKLNTLHIIVEKLPEVRTWEQICHQFLKIGQLLEKDGEAKEIINIATNKLRRIQKNNNFPKPSLFVQIGVKPVFAATKGSFINDLISFSGGINIAENAATGIYSREMVLSADPDYIFIVTMGISGNDEINIWKEFKTLNAVKNNKIFILDEYKMCSPTPITFVEMAEEIYKIIHK